MKQLFHLLSVWVQRHTTVRLETAVSVERLVTTGSPCASKQTVPVPDPVPVPAAQWMTATKRYIGLFRAIICSQRNVTHGSRHRQRRKCCLHSVKQFVQDLLARQSPRTVNRSGFNEGGAKGSKLRSGTGYTFQGQFRARVRRAKRSSGRVKLQNSGPFDLCERIQLG